MINKEKFPQAKKSLSHVSIQYSKSLSLEPEGKITISEPAETEPAGKINKSELAETNTTGKINIRACRKNHKIIAHLD